MIMPDAEDLRGDSKGNPSALKLSSSKLETWPIPVYMQNAYVEGEGPDDSSKIHGADAPA
jgi:hypothetical protein